MNDSDLVWMDLEMTGLDPKADLIIEIATVVTDAHLHLLAKGVNIPESIGLAGFNGVDLLDGLPMQLATMDACRSEIGRRAAEIICSRIDGTFDEAQKIVELTPTLNRGATLRS